MAPLHDVTRFICLFHDAGRARGVINALEQAGVGAGSVTTISQNTFGSADTLTEIGVPDRDLDHLQDGLRHGGVIVTLEAAEEQSHTIERIFHRFSADKVDEADVELAATDASALPVVAAPPVAPAYTTAAEPVTAGTVIPVAEESLLVGKREVDRGGVRVFRRTVEEPVQRDVTLHDERVLLEYREVNRPVTDADLRAGNQSIELVETAEVPVVEKVTRVVEEVRVGKVESDRTEVVDETLRHTEVDVEPLDTTNVHTPRD